MVASHLRHGAIDFVFTKNARDFVVEEIPLYPFSGKGAHLILKIRKKNLTTKQMLNIIAENLHIKRAEIGYAGLKDKHSMSIQYLSLDRKYERNLAALESENLKILDTTYHDNKLKIGHLKGNRFFVRLKKLTPINALKIEQICQILREVGMPNYFGFQRFGKNSDNFREGRDVLSCKLKIRDKKTAKFLISAFQSHLFNAWLTKRVNLSKIINDFSVKDAENALKLDIATIKNLKAQRHFFKILNGDIMGHYPNGKLFYNDENVPCVRESRGESMEFVAESVESAPESHRAESRTNAERFYNHTIAPTGLLCGKKALKARDLAGDFERIAMDELLFGEVGARRFAWVFVENLEFNYKEKIANGELNFTLPKGSYATILLEILANRTIGENDEF